MISREASRELLKTFTDEELESTLSHGIETMRAVADAGPDIRLIADVKYVQMAILGMAAYWDLVDEKARRSTPAPLTQIFGGKGADV